jgi:hypothetical protein
MFFLLRMAFWLGVVLVLLPSGSAQHAAQTSDVGTSGAISAASATVPKMLYDFLTEALAPKETGALPHGATPRGSVAKVEPVKSSPSSQNTLTPTDLAPAWHGAQPPKDAKHAA